jgi:steroid delta-isomerase-like uncharacterized protein
MTTNEAVVIACLDAYSRGDWTTFTRYLAPGYVHHSNSPDCGSDDYLKAAAHIRRAMPDLRLDVDRTMSEGDMVAIRWVVHGTHLGAFYGERPTGRPIVTNGIAMYRVADGLIAEDWEAMDMQNVMVQTSPFAGLPTGPL